MSDEVEEVDEVISGIVNKHYDLTPEEKRERLGNYYKRKRR
jgi:hypothetical protein